MVNLKNKNKIFLIVLALFCLSSLIQKIKTHEHEDEDYWTQEDINQIIDKSVITYGSVLRIENQLTHFYLYSNKYTWGSGSQLQIITGVRDKDDTQALWVIKERHEDTQMKATGEPVLCNDIIRLEHSATGKNLHSHLHRAWITDGQEACGFGNDGVGDVNDNFKII